MTIRVYRSSRAETIPRDFLGLSFETATLIKNNAGVNGYFFAPADTQLVTIFEDLGMRNLRIGGDSVDTTATPS
ncbi:MAG: hypothetical protein JRN15_11925, partial [Nitrososphaerota archaeon]|nr:hypothetical protein [Nitrososphaerota archaeon]